MITLETLRKQVRERADMQNSNFVIDSELDIYINGSYAELYDIVVSRFEDYYTKSLIFDIPAGNTFQLPDDFYKVRGVDFNLGGNYCEIRKWNFQKRNYTNYYSRSGRFPYLDYRQYRVLGDELHIIPQDQATGSYRMWYIPLAHSMVSGVLASYDANGVIYTSNLGLYEDGNQITIDLAGGGVAGSEVVTEVDNVVTVQIEDGVSTAQNVSDAINATATLVTSAVSTVGTEVQNIFAAENLTGGVVQVDGNTFNKWEEYIVIDAAIKCLVKEESDVRVLLAQKNALIKRIEEMASNRDAGEPETVTDVNSWDYWYR